MGCASRTCRFGTARVHLLSEGQGTEVHKSRSSYLEVWCLTGTDAEGADALAGLPVPKLPPGLVRPMQAVRVCPCLHMPRAALPLHCVAVCRCLHQGHECVYGPTCWGVPAGLAGAGIARAAAGDRGTDTTRPHWPVPGGFLTAPRLFVQLQTCDGMQPTLQPLCCIMLGRGHVKPVCNLLQVSPMPLKVSPVSKGHDKYGHDAIIGSLGARKLQIGIDKHTGAVIASHTSVQQLL